MALFCFFNYCAIVCGKIKLSNVKLCMKTGNNICLWVLYGIPMRMDI